LYLYHIETYPMTFNHGNLDYNGCLDTQ
jgi:hypothetical protein